MTRATDPAPLTAALTDPEALALEISVGPTRRYDALELLGRGGMGEVRLWRDRRIGREVAVKIARSGLGDDGRRRFAREALVQARLEHPAFVPVYDVAAGDDGELYFVMRRVRGRTLRSVLADRARGDGDVSHHRLLAAFVQLCLAIDYAHSRGVVHRDVKPDNIMLGDFGEVYLLDWGVAKLSGETERDAPVDAIAETAAREGTKEGSVLGTIGYMPPEQLRGQHASLDARADVYALGCVLFEILALEPMHRGTSFADLVASTMDGRHRSPAARATSRAIPPELDAIVVRATEGDRQGRFASARELGVAIEKFLEGDRDLALRREQARELAAQAHEALENARGDLELRVAAGRDAARAIALDPENDDARTTLVAAVAEPPVAPPAEAVEIVERERIERDRLVSRQGALTTFFIKLSLIPIFLFAVTVYEPVLAWGAVGVGVLSGFVWLAAARARGSATDRLALVAVALMCVENGLFTQWSTPYTISPMVAVATGAAVMLHAPVRTRALRLWMCLAVVLVPFALETIGVLAPTLTLGERSYHLQTTMASPIPAWAIVLHFLVVAVSSTGAVTGAIDRAREVDIRARSQAWLLERVLHRGTA